MIRAAQIVLDRAGYGPGASLALVAAEPQAPWAEWMTPGQVRAMREVIGDAKRRMEAGEPQPPIASRVEDPAAEREEARRLLHEASAVRAEVHRPVVREIVSIIVDLPVRDE